MTQRLDQMIADLTGDLLEMAGEAPLAVTRIEAALPMEFGLRPRAEIVSVPPENLQSRDLTPPLGQFSFALEIGRAGDV